MLLVFYQRRFMLSRVPSRTCTYMQYIFQLFIIFNHSIIYNQSIACVMKNPIKLVYDIRIAVKANM